MKTAGTSVEIYFEEAALPLRHDFERGHRTEEIESLSGVVGVRGPTPPDARWYHHMPAAVIRAQVGPEVWASYYKFCVIRNPFDKAVSFWWHQIPAAERRSMVGADFSVIRDSFREWIRPYAAGLVDRHTYMIDGKVAMDDFLRYESLVADLARVCARVGFAYTPERLGQYKGGFRLHRAPFQDYYDAASARAVRDAFGFELEYFGYQLTA